MKITRKEALKMIEDTNGKFFTVTFQKKDGSIRDMNARIGVKKGQVGGVATYKANPNNVGVYESNKGKYRCFNIERLMKIKFKGMEYIVGGE